MERLVKLGTLDFKSEKHDLMKFLKFKLHLLSLEVDSLRGWLVGVGEDDVVLRSPAGETFEGFVVANSSTNCSMSARGYLVGPEP